MFSLRAALMDWQWSRGIGAAGNGQSAPNQQQYQPHQRQFRQAPGNGQQKRQAGFQPAPAALAPIEVYVILFGVGRGELEGIYSLRAAQRDDGMPVDTVVAFSRLGDAQRYATLLEAAMEHEPAVVPLVHADLLHFCASSGYRCRVEPPGTLLIPPEASVGITDWERCLNLRRGGLAALGSDEDEDGDLDMGVGLDAEDIVAADDIDADDGTGVPVWPAAGVADLDAIRARLEAQFRSSAG